jgi:hypothetical protein
VTPASRLSAAFRRLGAIVGANLTRGEDEERRGHHGGPISELAARQTAFAAEVEARAAARRPD